MPLVREDLKPTLYPKRCILIGTQHTIRNQLMEELKNKIRSEGQCLDGGIIKVDGIINHRIDAPLMAKCGEEFASFFKDTSPTLILTAEVSGIGPALMTAGALGCPVLYARKKRPITMPEFVYSSSAPSRTKGEVTPLLASPEFLTSEERVLIIDDFLASGQTILGLLELCRQAQATVVGIGALVEKTFEEGRSLLSHVDVPIYSLAQITSLEDCVEVAP